MIRISFILLLLLFSVTELSAQDNLVPKYQIISPKAISAGIEGYSTPLFNISKSGHEVNAKVVYVPEFINSSSVIFFYIKESDDSIVQELKQLAIELAQIATLEKYAKTTLELTLKTYPEDIWTNNILIGNIAYSMIGITWDEQDEQEYIFISFPLHASISTTYSSRKNHSKKFRKLLQDSIVYGLEIQFKSRTLNIPFGFPLNITLKKIEEKHRTKK